jgi:hypothetical protein
MIHLSHQPREASTLVKGLLEADRMRAVMRRQPAFVHSQWSRNSQVFKSRHRVHHDKTVPRTSVVYLFDLFPMFRCSRQAGLCRRGCRARGSHHRVNQALKHGSWVLAITGVHRRCLDDGASGCNQPVEALPL